MISKLFVFNSEQTFYIKERHNFKPNTVREIDLNDSRFTNLIYWSVAGFNVGEIAIKIDSLNGSDYFIRQITDISIYNNLMIISWKPKKALK